MVLPDVNVWIALTFDSHHHCPRAVQWFNSTKGVKRFFCRGTQQSFLRIITSSKIVGIDALTMAEAWQRYDQFLADPFIDFLSEPPGVESIWRKLTLPFGHSPKVWNDAYLAAFAMAAGLSVVSFDSGFEQFAGLSVVVLA